jgi:hypothetical protein
LHKAVILACNALAVGPVDDADAFSWSMAQAAALRPAMERHDSAHVQL